MSDFDGIFEKIHNLIHKEGPSDFLSILMNNLNKHQDPGAHSQDSYVLQKSFLQKMIKEIDTLSLEYLKNSCILISVKNQKLLRICFQLITGLGISPCLIPGLGIDIRKRCSSVNGLPSLTLNDEQKYELLVECTDFFIRCYGISALKNLIISYHLSDYLAALIQIAFAPLKKPGVYPNFVMTQDLHAKLLKDKQKYVITYEELVANCFQPILMKELLILQSVTNPAPPAFVKRLIAKEMSRRFLSPGGLLSLIRCFIENYQVDSGLEWKKIDMICKLVTATHGSEADYMQNVTSQIKQILTLNNSHYLKTAVACLISLHEKYPDHKLVKELIADIFQSFSYDELKAGGPLPGTIALSPQEIDQKVNILHACVTRNIDCPIRHLIPNIYILFLLGMHCNKNTEMQSKINNIIITCIEKVKKDELPIIIKICLFGKKCTHPLDIGIEEYDAGLALKFVSGHIDYPKAEAILYLLTLLKFSTDSNFIKNLFEVLLSMLIDTAEIRSKKNSKLTLEYDVDIVDEVDQNYAYILQLLSEISASPKVIIALKSDPAIVLDFIEYFILKHDDINDECVTVALVLLNTILSNADDIDNIKLRLNILIPVLKEMWTMDSNINNILCEEAVSLIVSDESKVNESECGKAIADVFDHLLPVRAHGIIQLTKLIEAKDSETILKKHYIFCIFQEQLKDPDSYIYLSAINGIASLGTHCTEDVLHVLCKEYLEISTDTNDIDTAEKQNKIAELRMKIGDVIVKVIKRLGDMAISYKNVLLNTVLCACRDEDPLIRSSALSNLAEIVLVLHYKVGTIIYEILLCIWCILETDKAIECRRAAVMVISSLLKGLGKDTLIELKDNILPIYRTLKNLYNSDKDDIVRLHAQIALDELNATVKAQVNMQREFGMLDKPDIIFK